VAVAFLALFAFALYIRGHSIAQGALSEHFLRSLLCGDLLVPVNPLDLQICDFVAWQAIWQGMSDAATDDGCGQ
jgi:hypothetical protein